MILFTVDEARILKKQIAGEKEFKKEYSKFSGTVNLFTCWFFVLTSIKALFVATIIVLYSFNFKGIPSFGYLLNIYSCLPRICDS